MTSPPRPGGVDLSDLVMKLLLDARQTRRYDIGYPGATDLTFPGLAEIVTGQLLNNVGDPWDDGHGRNHTKQFERQVVGTVADLLGAPRGWWGYVTTGSTEGTLHALDEAGQTYPDAIVYTSTAAHYSVAKAARLLKMPLVRLPVDARGRMDVVELHRELKRRRQRPAVIVATAGTTMTEAVDDVGLITELCEQLGITRRRLHVDAALSGIPLAMLPDDERPEFDFGAGATSMVVSGHKFLSTLMPCGVLVHARQPRGASGNRVSYTGSADSTITGSRSGHTPLLLWWALSTLGMDGLRRRARASRELAVYTHAQLRELGWPTRLNRNAFTVTLDEPPPPVLAKWVLASDRGTAHIVCMPGVGRDQIDEFVGDLGKALAVGGARRAARVPATDPHAGTSSLRVRGHRRGAAAAATLAV
jgi:histidine decarboxylase